MDAAGSTFTLPSGMLAKVGPSDVALQLLKRAARHFSDFTSLAGKMLTKDASRGRPPLHYLGICSRSGVTLTSSVLQALAR